MATKPSPLFGEAAALTRGLDRLKSRVADRAGESNLRFERYYADFDDRANHVEGIVRKRLDEHAMNFEAQVREELSNLGEHLENAASTGEQSNAGAEKPIVEVPEAPAVVEAKEVASNDVAPFRAAAE